MSSVANSETQQQQQQKLNVTRLQLYLQTAKGKMNENFTTHPCLGLHFGFGDSEIDRLQKAVVRHGRQDQFDNLTLPVDVLLRTLSFIPNPRDPRLTANRATAGSGAAVASNNDAKADERAMLQRKTMLRVAATCSTLLFTVMENQCLLGYKGSKANGVPAEDASRASAAILSMLAKRDAEAEAERKRNWEEKQLEQIERERLLHRLGDYNDPTYEGLPPRAQMIWNIEKELARGAELLETIEDLSLASKKFAKKKPEEKKSGGGGWLWGSKKK